MTFVALLLRSFTRHRALILGLAMLLSGFQVLLVLIARNLQRLGLFSQMAAMMPPFIQEALGGALVASFVGSVALGFFHPIVMLSLSCAAIYMASEPAGEVEDGLVDLVVARPVARHLVVTRSACVYAVGTAAIVLVMFLANRGAVQWLTPASAATFPAARLAWVASNLLAVVWCFGAASLALAARARRRTAAAGTVALVAVFLYLLQFAAAAWDPLRPLARASPFHYYEAMRTLTGSVTPVRDIALLMSATTALLVLAYASYMHRDL
jgi:ABC-2 type transport system permease protein